jgi:hypothetical protein
MSQLLPFARPGYWFKGNLHTHTTQSDGEYTPEQAIAWYRAHGYDFMAISDHWIHTPGRVIADDFLTLNGEELNGPGYHMLAIGHNPASDRTLADDPQALAQRVRAQGGMAFFAHPYWTGQTSAQIAAVSGITGIEVFNSICEGFGLGHARVQWDELLARGLRLNALAVDDTHWRHGEQGMGFVMVRAPELSGPAILQALAEGAFYASSGPRISDLRVVQLAGQTTLRVCCSPCTKITFHGAGPTGHRFSADPGAWLDSAAWPLDAEQIYLRVECEDDRGGVAWSNPVYLSDILL